MRFAISRIENFKKFCELIGFTHPKKKTILERICTSYTDIHKTQKTILNLINDNNKQFTAREISDITHFNHDNVYSHLTNLAKEGKINKNYNQNLVLWSSISL